MTGLAIITIFGTTLTAATAKGGGSLSERDGGHTTLQRWVGSRQREQARNTVERRADLGSRSLHVSRSESDVTYWRSLAQKRLRLLGRREHRIVSLLVTVHKLRGGGARSVSKPQRRVSGGVKGVICSVFGAHCSEALRVAWCESRYNVRATNGDYWGLFQEGSYARSAYGFGWDALSQARSAYRYFLAAGWSPWTCRP